MIIKPREFPAGHSPNYWGRWIKDAFSETRAMP